MKTKKYKLKDLLQIKNGKDYKEFSQGTIPVFGSGGIIAYINKSIYNGESVLLPRKGSLSNIQYVSGDFWTVDTIYWTIINKELVLPKFLYYYLTLLDLSRLDSGSALPSMTFDSYYDIDVFLPSLEIQKYIINAILPIENKINKNNHINDNLQQVIIIIFNRWFNQFEYDLENGNTYLSAGGKLVFNTILKKKIPEGWIVENIARNKLSSFIDVGIEYFDSKNYIATANVNGTMIQDGNNVTYENRESRANMQPSLNSIWFAKMKNSIKHIFIPSNSQWFIDKYILSTGFCGIKCADLSFPYIASVIMQPYFELAKDKMAHGATQQAINNDDLENIPLLVPSDEVLQKYNKIVLPFFKKMNEIQHENQKLKILRDNLLPLLMNGQIITR